jgi:hypothetical protein
VTRCTHLKLPDVNLCFEVATHYDTCSREWTCPRHQCSRHSMTLSERERQLRERAIPTSWMAL